MTYKLLSFIVILIAVLGNMGQEEDISIPEWSWLEQAGYSTGSFQIELRWIEHTKKGDVHGFLLQNTITGEFEEVYLDKQGVKLDLEKLRELHLNPKNWEPSNVSIPTKLGIREKKIVQKRKGTPQLISTQKLQLKSSKYTLNLPVPLFLDERISDNQQQEKGLLEIGKVIPLERPLILFDKNSSICFTEEKIDEYSIYSLSFFAEGAVGIKFHLVFAELLPPLHKIYIKGNNSDTELLPISVEEEDIWTPLIFSSDVTLFYIKPASSSVNPISFNIVEYSYVYKNPIDELTKLATCYEDVMCYEPWKTLSRGIVGIARVSSPNLIFCTGSLLSDGKDEEISRLILTAFHCVDNQESANNLDFIWMYQSTNCNGTVPNITQVPKTTGGADFLVGSATNEGTDMTLLRMKNTPPVDVVELGFTNEIIPLGVNVIAIHHPRGTYKRISFGNKTITGSPINQGRNLRPLDRYHEVIYTLSSTESGSSGCPLFIAETQQIIGQLWGGQAGCSLMNEPDYFGRLDVSYPLIEPYIFVPPNIFDVDGSGIVDNKDMNQVINAVLGLNSRLKTDLNNDGKTDALDIQTIKNQI